MLIHANEASASVWSHFAVDKKIDRSEWAKETIHKKLNVLPKREQECLRYFYHLGLTMSPDESRIAKMKEGYPSITEGECMVVQERCLESIRKWCHQEKKADLQYINEEVGGYDLTIQCAMGVLERFLLEDLEEMKKSVARMEGIKEQLLKVSSYLDDTWAGDLREFLSRERDSHHVIGVHYALMECVGRLHKEYNKDKDALVYKVNYKVKEKDVLDNIGKVYHMEVSRDSLFILVRRLYDSSQTYLEVYGEHLYSREAPFLSGLKVWLDGIREVYKQLDEEPTLYNISAFYVHKDVEQSFFYRYILDGKLLTVVRILSCFSLLLFFLTIGTYIDYSILVDHVKGISSSVGCRDVDVFGVSLDKTPGEFFKHHGEKYPRLAHWYADKVDEVSKSWALPMSVSKIGGVEGNERKRLEEARPKLEEATKFQKENKKNVENGGHKKVPLKDEEAVAIKRYWDVHRKWYDGKKKDLIDQAGQGGYDLKALHALHSLCRDEALKRVTSECSSNGYIRNCIRGEIRQTFWGLRHEMDDVYLKHKEKQVVKDPKLFWHECESQITWLVTRTEAGRDDYDSVLTKLRRVYEKKISEYENTKLKRELRVELSTRISQARLTCDSRARAFRVKTSLKKAATKRSSLSERLSVIESRTTKVEKDQDALESRTTKVEKDQDELESRTRGVERVQSVMERAVLNIKGTLANFKRPRLSASGGENKVTCYVGAVKNAKQAEALSKFYMKLFKERGLIKVAIVIRSVESTVSLFFKNDIPSLINEDVLSNGAYKAKLASSGDQGELWAHYTYTG